MSVPLKLKDSAAPTELQKFSDSAENYLAYQIALNNFSKDSDNTSRIATHTIGSFRPIGTFIDTYFDSAVGTSAGSGGFYTTSTTSTVLLQRNGVETNTDSDVRRLIYLDSDASMGYTQNNGGVDTLIPQLKIREMNDSDQNTLVDRLNSTIYTNDYPGTYILTANVQDSDYQTYKQVFNDTRTDGAFNPYYLRQRTAFDSAGEGLPDTVRPFAIKRSNGDSGDYQGLQEMTDRQIQQSLGTVSRNQSGVTAGNIGAYLLLSSAQGNPTAVGYSGTWVSKGTATDTRQAIVDATYTRGRVENYSRQRDSTFSQTFLRLRVEEFTQNFEGNYTSNFENTFLIARTSVYSPGFVGNYTNTFSRTSNRNFTRNSTRTSTYTRNSTANFEGNFQGTSNYTGNFIGNFLGEYVGSQFTTYQYGWQTYWRIVQDYYGSGATLYVVWGNTTKFQNHYSSQSSAQSVSSVIGNDGLSYFKGSSQGGYSYTSDFSVARNEQVTYTRESTRQFTRTSQRQNTFARNFTGDFTGNYSRTLGFAGNFTGDFTGNFSNTFTRTSAGTFSRNFIGDYTGDFTRTSSRNFTRERNTDFLRTSTTLFAGNYTGNYTGNFTGNYAGAITISVTQGTTNYISNNGTEYSHTRTLHGNLYQGYRLGTIQHGTSSGQTVRIYYRTVTTISPALGPVHLTYLTLTDNNSDNGVVISYAATATSSFDTVNNAMTVGGTPADSRAFAFSRLAGTNTSNTQYNGIRHSGTISTTASYTRTSTRTSIPNYLRYRTGSFEGDYTGDFIGDYSRNYTGNYTTEFDRTRVSNYVGAQEFTRIFAGNYTGDFVGNFTRTSTRQRGETFLGTYTGDFSRSFEGNYSRTFTGDYAGTEIGTSIQNIETYTLYVRTA